MQQINKGLFVLSSNILTYIESSEEVFVRNRQQENLKGPLSGLRQFLAI